MIIAAGVAAQAASALANAMQGKSKAGGASRSASTDFQNLTADIDSLLGGGPAAPGSGPGTGSIRGDLMALGSDLLGTLGLNAQQPAGSSGTGSPSWAAQAYGAASTLGT